MKNTGSSMNQNCQGQHPSECSATLVPEAYRHLMAQMLRERMTATTTLASGMAHEVNNPLTYVLGNLELVQRILQEKGKPSDGQVEIAREALADALAGAHRIQDLIKTMRSFSEEDKACYQPVDPEKVIDHAIQVSGQAHQDKVRIRKHYAPIPAIGMSEARLGQLALNLLLNAIQAPLSGPSHRREIRVRLESDKEGNAILEVTDDGTGMTPEDQRRAFDPFFTTKAPGIGTGLGLAICHDIVTKAGGDITVNSRTGVGTTFRIRIPALSTKNQTADRADDSQHQPARKKVLVVDDDEGIRKATARVLKQYEVETAASGAEALERCRRSSYDVILCELALPAMSGTTFFRELAKVCPGLEQRVVFISGTNINHKQPFFVDERPKPVLYKPFGVDQLQNIIDGIQITMPPRTQSRPPRQRRLRTLHSECGQSTVG